MKKSILIFLMPLLLFSFNGCKASEKDEIDIFIQKDFKNYLRDNRKLILEANKDVKLEPALKEIIFKNTFVKLKTAQSLLDDEYGNWLEGLGKNGFDYTDFNDICWMTIYMQNYINNMDENYKSNITDDTRKSVNHLYEARDEIIKLRDNKDKALASSQQTCK
ncbi:MULTISPECIES: hypothetical protein [Acinetobacter]|uniref:Lipoprotein n=1 Tax=Acinetobacter haemolyticus TaxID=29430 RepID=A0AAJ3D7X3_ACIHA|nr:MULTISPECIES: hypothetical protein [Acinetobacter]ATZ67757.1 hypothetical protein BSR56_10645 [Acinetobacter haemolyticus]EEH69481.1 hypothetical protein HMPREF0023_0992 [Acinetobacter sp. ATCC 27244]NAR17696.1 hypothetical protein [Acinetobacter haemolyticus]NAR36537.1 hypothetical protein [Acinetobacter haemolyticus]NAR46060.1 hypothetical protein [Acinetobacter haemolyticus]